jgi:hypothetical protein
MKIRSRTSRRLGLEFLEARQMLSATVTAMLSGGNLTLTGNKNDAYVEVHETAASTFLVTGLNGTKISFGASTGTSESVSGVTGSLTVNLPGSGSGTQSFELDTASGKPDTAIGGNLAISMGNAADTVLIQGPLTIDGNTSISTGNGNSSIAAFATGIGGGLTIATGSGNQTISVGKVENLGSGYDVMVDGGSVSITTGAGNSCVTVVDTDAPENGLTINLGSGNNKVVVGSESDTSETDIFLGANLSIALGNGNGTVQVVNTEAEGNLVVTTGNGNANISIGMVNQTGDYDVIVGGYMYVSTCPGNAVVTVVNSQIGIEEEEEFNLVKLDSQVMPSSLIDGDLAVELGAGNDKVTIGSSTDEFPPDVQINENAYIDIASGNATVAIQSTAIDNNLEISHQAGNTAITIGSYDPFAEEGPDVFVEGNVSITTSTGNATIAIGGTAENDTALIYGTLTIVTGSGNASISLIEVAVFGNTSITTGTGNATVNLLDDFFDSNLSIVLSSGNGSVSLKDTIVEGSTTLNGGGNGTLYYDATDDFVGGISYSHFKKVTT